MKRFTPRLRGAVTLRAFTTVIAVVALVLTLASCGSSGRVTHNDTGGPLSATSGIGGNSIAAPDARPWAGSFGGFGLCAREPGVEIELERIRMSTEVEPLEVSTYLREVGPVDKASSGRDDDAGIRTIFYSALGSPPGFDEPYAELKMAGDWSPDVAGTIIDQGCDNRLKPARGFTELVFVMQAGSAGGQISDARIDYLADGEPHTLILEWVMTLCGAAITDRDIC